MNTLTLYWHGFKEFAARYYKVFGYAWQTRKQLDSVPRLSHEIDFLPSAIALQERPPPAAPRVTMWVLIAFAFLTLAWAFIGKVDMVAMAPGKVVPNDRTKTIQSFETATVRAIHVTDGQSVKAGDVLIELDDVGASADKTRLVSELANSLLQVERGKAMIELLRSGKRMEMQRPVEVDPLAWRDAAQLLKGQQDEYLAKLARLDAVLKQREAESKTTFELVRKLEQTVPIAQQRAENIKRLADQDLVSKYGYLDVQQAKIEQEADLAAQRGRYAEIKAALNEVLSQKEELLTESRRVSLDSVNDGMRQIASFEQELRKATNRRDSYQLTAPVDGTVQQLVVHTVGGVVSQAQPLMMIVPNGDTLEIEAFVENKDIGFIRKGQDAAVKIETFQFTKYGLIDASVSSVSHDAIADEKRGLIYSTRVKMKGTHLNVEGVPVSVIPGMSVTVEIRTGTRRVIEYFTGPFLRYSHDSFRER